MAELRASPVVNPSYKRIADVLANLQGPMGEIIPFTDANPFKFLMPAASTFENLAYGNAPLAMPPGVTNRRLPIVKTGREGEFTDLASLGLLATGVPQVARGTMQGANYLGDVLTQATRAAPPAAPMRALDEIARMSPVPQAMSGSRDLIRSSADNLAQELNGLGFQAKVQHSGSRAGPSSYVQIYDPETGRFFTKPIRFSGHGKGPFEAAGVIDVQDPTTDIPNIVQEALQMRGMGPSATLQKQAQKQAIADELIAGGMKPKKAYAEAEQRIAGLLEPQAGGDKTKQFLEMAEKGRLQMAKDRAKELKDLKEGKSTFAELSLNWDDPQTYDLVDEYAKKGFKNKVVNQGGRNVTYLFKDEKDLKGVLSAVTPADYGRAYGYSDEDIARFYLERGLGPQDFFEDMNKDPLQQFLSGR
jgi:hypothetical protein